MATRYLMPLISMMTFAHLGVETSTDSGVPRCAEYLTPEPGTKCKIHKVHYEIIKELGREQMYQEYLATIVNYEGYDHLHSITHYDMKPYTSKQQIVSTII